MVCHSVDVQVADEFLARVDAARAKAEAAVDAGNHTLQDAKNILSYLRGGDMWQGGETLSFQSND